MNNENIFIADKPITIIKIGESVIKLPTYVLKNIIEEYSDKNKSITISES